VNSSPERFRRIEATTHIARRTMCAPPASSTTSSAKAEAYQPSRLSSLGLDPDPPQFYFSSDYPRP
jgi:hypothetical protein